MVPCIIPAHFRICEILKLLPLLHHSRQTDEHETTIPTSQCRWSLMEIKRISPNITNIISKLLSQWPLGAVSRYRCHLTIIGIPMLKIRWSHDLLVFKMGIPIPGKTIFTQIAKFMGPTCGPPGSWRPQMGPTVAPWTLLSGYIETGPILLTWEYHSHSNDTI